MAPGFWQIVIVILLIVVVFGSGRLPNIAENMAKGLKSFKKGLRDEDEAAAPESGKIADQPKKDHE